MGHQAAVSFSGTDVLVTWWQTVSLQGFSESSTVKNPSPQMTMSLVWEGYPSKP